MITVLGGSGFIGSRLAAKVGALGLDCYTPNRAEDITLKPLGHVVYCIGLTADFRDKPFETVDAHVTQLSKVLQHCEFDSLLYLSSTRVYGQVDGTAAEDDPLTLQPSNADQLYNASKILGESVTLSSGIKTRVVRLSNVYGADFGSSNFLTSAIRDAVRTDEVVLQTSLDSAKDYINVDVVVTKLVEIAMHGQSRVYNLACGRNVTNAELIGRIQQLTNCHVSVVPDARRQVAPRIAVSRVTDEFGLPPSDIVDDMETLVALYRKHYAGV